MAVGDIISVARYNVMQDRANKVLGVGGGAYGETFGYGQSVARSSLPTNVATNPILVSSCVWLCMYGNLKIKSSPFTLILTYLRWPFACSFCIMDA